MKHLKIIIFTMVMFAITHVLSYMMKNPIVRLSDNPTINYQVNGFLLAILTLGIIYLFADKKRLSYLNVNKTSGDLKPVSWFGIKQGKWEEDGWSYAIILALTIGIVTFLSVFQQGFEFQFSNLLLVIPMAASNAFIEEVIFRLGYVTMGENEGYANYGMAMSILVFGILHYWGAMPNGLLGSVMAGYLGFFMAKSIQETKGFFWAFIIHFILDIVIFTMIFNV